jgi:GT2 family glycosyltransferase
MFHSVIIPHYNRNEDLRHCLFSLALSQAACNRHDVEVIVVDSRSRQRPTEHKLYPHMRAVVDTGGLVPVTITDIKGAVTYTENYKVYSKTRALNVGFDAADGELLTFLDADTIVPPDFFNAWDERTDPHDPPTKLAYRVRNINDAGQKTLGDGPAPRTIRALFGRWYEHWIHTGEIYIDPTKRDIADGEIDYAPKDYDPHLLIGNSQFTIPRENLGDLRFNEEFVGAGYEDVWLLREIYRRHGPQYRAVLADGPIYGLLQIKTVDHGKHWRPSGLWAKNERRYRES